jgi:SAM-dependent methyltransferase
MTVARGSKLNIPKASRDAIREGAVSSAEALAELIVHDLPHEVEQVLDVGCGEGWLVRALRDRGVHAFGVDGDDLDGVDMVVDLTAPPYPDFTRDPDDDNGDAVGTLSSFKPFDLACCLEVAEHVPAVHERRLIRWLTGNAPVVLFSAALPGQGGDGHVNERPLEHWAALFGAEGWYGSGVIRADIWGDERFEWWYRQNLCVFWDPTLTGGDLYQPDGCVSVIHPGMWQHFHGSAGWGP